MKPTACSSWACHQHVRPVRCAALQLLMLLGCVPAGWMPPNSGSTAAPTTTAPPSSHQRPVCVVGATPPAVHPDHGCYLGTALNMNDYPQLATYGSQLGFTPAAYNVYVNLPLTAGDKQVLAAAFAQITSMGGIAVLTVSPSQGLAACVDTAVVELATIIHQWETAGLAVILRFAPEMNGRYGSLCGRCWLGYALAWQGESLLQ